MKAKTKLIATLMAMCLVITLGVFGILAVKTLNMSVGGNITFTADGISFEVSAGEFKTTSGAEYSGITSQTGKLQAFAMNTNTKLADVQDKINSWAGLDLVATESLGDPVLHFSITNLMEDEILSFDPSITLGTNINDNMEILISPKVANIQPEQEQEFAITFKVVDKTINAGLTGANYSGFSIDVKLSTALVSMGTSYNGMTLTPSETDSSKYVVGDASSASGDVVIPAFVQVGNTKYPVTEIADYAFFENKGITSITIPNTVITVGEGSFSDSGLTGGLIIPNSVKTLKAGSFSGSAVSNVVFGTSIETIGQGALQGTALTSAIIPNNVKTIDMYAFACCESLTSVVIGNGVTTIGDGAFMECFSLTNVVIGTGVTSIGYEAFGYIAFAVELTFTIKNPIPPAADFGNVFTSTTIKAIYVPAGSVNAYKTATNWSEYASRIQAIVA